MKKYNLDMSDKIKVGGKTLYRIVSLCDFGNVKKGDRGGYIQSHKNLSHDNNAWVFDNARVCGKARVYDDARVAGKARVYDKARVAGKARVYDKARVAGNAWVAGKARVSGKARVADNDIKWEEVEDDI